MGQYGRSWRANFLGAHHDGTLLGEQVIAHGVVAGVMAVGNKPDRLAAGIALDGPHTPVVIREVAGVLYPAFGLLLSPIFAGAAMGLVSVVTNALRLNRVRL